ncbi:MAG: hypothetical protein Q8P18_16420, partial [Pseudomonadota bacterium]|nr:hypothetical protein [Pseudomonadota bacterium]
MLRPSSPPASPPGRRTPRETTRLAAALALAILGPALIVAVAARGLDGPTLTTNLPPGREKAARAMDARLAAAPPGILIVGSSKAETDLDPAAIKGVLGYPRPIVQAEIQASAAPAWYAFLQQRVFAAGYQPDLVIVYGTLAGMLEVASGDWWSRSRADNQQLTDTELLQRKLLGGKVSAQLARARARGSALRTGAIEGVRDLVVGGLFAPAGVGWRASGRRLAEPALEAVFGSDATLRGAGTEHAGPVAEPASGPQMEVGTDPEASLIPDIVALVRSHGAAVVFVRAPLPIGSRHLDMVSPDRERAALLLLDSLGAGWIDLHDQPLPPGAFRDFVHLSGSGRAAASRQLATALRDAKVLEHGALPPPVLPLAFRARREGPAVELGPLGPLTPVPGYGCLWFQAAPALGFLSDEALTTLGLGPVSPVTASLGDTPMRAHRDPDPRACTQSFSHAPDGLFLSPARQLQSPRFTLGLADSLPLSSATGVPTWWVYPGSSLTFSFDSAWEPGPWMARVRARILGSGGATLEAGGSRVGLLPAGRVHMASIVGPAPTGPWELTLHAEPGAWVVVDALAVGGAPAV